MITHLRHFPLRVLTLLACCALSAATLVGQTAGPTDDRATERVYAVKPWLEGGLSVAGIGATTYMFQKINDKDRFDAEALDRSTIPAYDRWALPATAANEASAAAASDYGFYTAIALPFSLVLDPAVRRQAVDVLILYLETQAINGLVYAASPLGPNFVDRERPLSYYDDLPARGRGDGGNLNSFFSGHVSTAATGSYFFAKVLSDFHPEWTGKQRALLFGAATLPPLYVSVQRIRGLRHFPSDVAVGFAVGTLVGILNPQVHKSWQQKHRSRLSLGGSVSQGASVAGFTLTF